MGDWQELAQSVFIGLIFSFLVAKLISMVISFRDENLRVARQEDLPAIPVESEPTPSYAERTTEQEFVAAKAGIPGDEKSGVREENQRASEQPRVQSESLLGEDDDDWEGVESTELDEAFSAATAFVAAAAADRLSQKVSNDIQLQLYGLYKIATEGPCNTPQPSALKISARAKWHAWQKLGAMPPEEAMQKYITIVTDLYPTWATGSVAKSRDGGTDASTSDAKGTIGPVFSTFIYEEESEKELKMDAIHASAREGEMDNLLKYMDNGVPVDLRDGEGRTPLHWAVDRGHLNIVELLVSRNADVNAKDNEGQTPLHYATVCEREGIAKFLVKQNADVNVKDNEGNSPGDLCELDWPWMH
ncbi:PREDICTED: acyl-CoA-binding domain-containing protein 1 [Nelumbo nucifera]|uniref:Acyl-CoA-binding domain-containing protein 1 n=1 Tax=Nelumbo nucifera TaxID=4432 RepID=A0A1U8AW91_NELNU|nr:PREDICTED: acyl-CoA-binding domain-containing protein 1 [Nelumbo nucifera]